MVSKTALVLFCLSGFLGSCESKREEPCTYSDVMGCVQKLNQLLDVKGHHPVLHYPQMVEIPVRSTANMTSDNTTMDNKTMSNAERQSNVKLLQHRITASLVDEMCRDAYPDFKGCLDGLKRNPKCNTVPVAKAIVSTMKEICGSKMSKTHLPCIQSKSDVVSCISEFEAKKALILVVERPELGKHVPWPDQDTAQCLIVKTYMDCVEKEVEVSCGADGGKWYKEITREKLVALPNYVLCDLYVATGGTRGLTAGIIVAALFLIVFLIFVWYWVARKRNSLVSKV